MRISRTTPIAQPPSDQVIRAGFFTTKPAGQGTGLGISLAYDIVKVHSGSITVNTYYREPGEISTGPFGKVETKEGKGSEFVIVLSTG